MYVCSSCILPQVWGTGIKQYSCRTVIIYITHGTYAVDNFDGHKHHCSEYASGRSINWVHLGVYAHIPWVRILGVYYYNTNSGIFEVN